MQREKTIIRTSVIGILANAFLAAFKAAAGMISGSIAITLDAVNNLSDALSSVITIIGTKLAGKKPDRKHPYGHGRVEYLTAIVIAVIVLYAGVTSLVESVKKIIEPATPDYAPVTLIIIAVAVLVKIVLGRYVKGVGKKVNSESLVASGEDATLDSIISASTLVAAAVYLIWHVQLEAWLGAVISLVIVKSGVEMLSESISDILGKRVESEFAIAIKKTIAGCDDVYGAYDLVLHSYGPDTTIGSVHIEVPDTMDMHRLDTLQREIVRRVFEEHGVILTGISVYPRDTQDGETAEIRQRILDAVMAHPHVLQMHGFYLNKATKQMQFDIIIDYDVKERVEIYQQIVGEIEAMFPDYQVHITLDVDVSD